MEEIKNKTEKLEKNEEEKVSGGYIHNRPNSVFKYVLVSDNYGNVIARYKTLEEAQEAAKALADKSYSAPVSTKILTDEEFKALYHSPDDDYHFIQSLK